MPGDSLDHAYDTSKHYVRMPVSDLRYASKQFLMH